jgi:hypothetical protein
MLSEIRNCFFCKLHNGSEVSPQQNTVLVSKSCLKKKNFPSYWNLVKNCTYPSQESQLAQLLNRVRICKLSKSPGIDSAIDFVAWRSVPTTQFVVQARQAT